jgi:pimeloyl-ACP methyl ester carboxylesterase
MPSANATSSVSITISLREPTGVPSSSSQRSRSSSSDFLNSPSRALEAPTDYSSESDGGLFSLLDDESDGGLFSLLDDESDGGLSSLLDDESDGDLFGLMEDDSDSEWSLFDNGQSAGDASEDGGVESGKKPVVIISHGIASTGLNMMSLARQFEDAGYHVETPTDMLNPFDGSGAVDAYNRLEAQNNPELDLNNVVLVGHSAGGAAAQQASTELGDNVAGVITIDGAPAMSTNREVPHTNFSHLFDPLGMVVGFENFSVPSELRSNEVLFGGHMMAMTGLDGRNYVDAADEMLGR